VPGGSENPSAYNQPAAQAILPAELLKLHDAPEDKPTLWAPFRGDHALLAPFQRWIREVDPDFAQPDSRPFARRFWDVKANAKEAVVIANFADDNRRAVLVERPLGRGRTILITSPLNPSRLIGDKDNGLSWHNYWTSSFGFILADRLSLYLAGETGVPELNFLAGQVPRLSLAPGAAAPFTVRGPGLAAAEQALKPPTEPDGRISVPQAHVPGQYAVMEGQGKVAAAFSLNIRTEENDLERIAKEEIEEALGKGSLLQVGKAMTLGDALQSAKPPPVELLPYLMIGLLLLLTVESLLANRFYRRPAPSPGEEPEPGAGATP
jgi:hypothetical protein